MSGSSVGPGDGPVSHRYTLVPLQNGSILLFFNLILMKQGLVWLSTAKS